MQSTLTFFYSNIRGRIRSIADYFADSGYYAIVPKILQPAMEGAIDGDGDNRIPFLSSIYSVFLLYIMIGHADVPFNLQYTVSIKWEGIFTILLIIMQTMP